MGSNQYWAGRVYDVCLLYDGSTRRLTESGFMEKPGIEPATPGLQGIALIHYTTGASYLLIPMPKKYTIPWWLHLILWQLLYRLNKYDISNNMS